LSRTFRILDKDEFPDVFQLMKLSFPPSEFRSYEGELNLFNHSNYKVLAVEENGTLQAFIAEWIIEGVRYVEHFAVNPQVRGQGLGSKIIRKYLGQATTPVIIEVEANDTAIAKRRITFYERLGFALSDIEYVQPLLQPSSTDVLLRLMHYPAELPAQTLQDAKRGIFQTVYI
jgi:ribosomal protein S18 acetylase RimI-like enzyme